MIDDMHADSVLSLLGPKFTKGTLLAFSNSISESEKSPSGPTIIIISLVLELTIFLILNLPEK